jgi:hypothetical protein
MMKISIFHFTLVMTLLGSCGGESHVLPQSRDDRDGDLISDSEEGRYERGGPDDSDGDTTPDYLDPDSDDDEIPDHVEAGDADLESPPVDSDGDGQPDYRDTDSDDNGLPDVEEGAMDSDGDGQRDYVDDDNDGDWIPDTVELLGDPEDPVDSDGDGIPDYMDFDSDNDTISDRDEQDVDTDGDGVPDYLDEDSDDDGIADSVEAGDSDIATRPFDTDGDYFPDFRDLDSDDDGLSDACENEEGLSPLSTDSDGDGAGDRLEWSTCTDPLDPSSNPGPLGDHAFLMQFGRTPEPMIMTLLPHHEPYYRTAGTTLRDDTTDAEDATVFVDHVEANTSGDVLGHVMPSFTCVPDLPASDTTGDTIPDTFTDLRGVVPCFDVHTRLNGTVVETDTLQTLVAYIDVRAEDGSVLDTLDLDFIVPSSSCNPAPCGE